jgi:hypothetical protein
MPAPTLAVLRLGEQVVDQFLVRVRRLVRHECFNRFRRGGQPGQVVVGAADQLAPSRRLGNSESLLFEPRQDERIDRVADRRCILNRRGCGFRKRSEGPVLSVLIGDFELLTNLSVLSIYGAGPWRTHLDPPHEYRDLVGLELRVGRHLETFIFDRLDQQALVWLAGYERRSGVATRNRGA